jgi:hypothetical protein
LHNVNGTLYRFKYGNCTSRNILSVAAGFPCTPYGVYYPLKLMCIPEEIFKGYEIKVDKGLSFPKNKK